MSMADNEAMATRRDAVFRAGAEAKEPKPFFQGAILGSMESCTFFDGYASTHPDFVNPYRKRRRHHIITVDIQHFCCMLTKLTLQTAQTL